jgi:hypothetical protein
METGLRCEACACRVTSEFVQKLVSQIFFYVFLCLLIYIDPMVTTRAQHQLQRTNNAVREVFNNPNLVREISGKVNNIPTMARLRASMPQFMQRSLLNTRRIRNELERVPVPRFRLQEEHDFKFVRNMRNYLNPNTNAEKNILKKMNNLQHELQALRNKHKRIQYNSLVNTVTLITGLNEKKLSPNQKKALVNTALYHYQQNPNTNKRRNMMSNMRSRLHRQVRTLFPTRNAWQNVREVNLTGRRGVIAPLQYPGNNPSFSRGRFM